jgi:hypothetical protein
LKRAQAGLEEMAPGCQAPGVIQRWEQRSTAHPDRPAPWPTADPCQRPLVPRSRYQ